jgi:hypothetical protein
VRERFRARLVALLRKPCWGTSVGARAETIDAFRDAFATLCYSVCDNDQLEPGYEKVALFALAGAPKHAAKQW